MSWGAVPSPLAVLSAKRPNPSDMPEFNFTGTELVAEMRRLASVLPDQRAACMYVDSDTEQPLCIGGRALANLGVPLAALKLGEGIALDVLLERLRITHTAQEAQWARGAQNHQDIGDNWGQAVVRTDRLFPTMAMAVAP